MVGRLEDEDSLKPQANPGYVLGQLARALTTSQQHSDPETRARADARVKRWIQVFQGMLQGGLEVGSRTPVAGTPAWATLEVVTGGFATGALLAEGPLQEHERTRLKTIGWKTEEGARAALNASYLTEAGLAELRAMLREGTYRVQVPEEGALLVVAWLLDHGREDTARALLEELGPWFARLRFYPAPQEQPQTATSLVRLQDLGATLKQLESIVDREVFLRQRESVQVWDPLYDRAVALLIETVNGDLPRVQLDPQGKPIHKPNGWYAVEGGWPCQQYPEGWNQRARALVEECDRLREQHSLCKKPDGESAFAKLRRFLEIILKSPRRLSGREVGQIRCILAGVLHKRGQPNSERLRSLRSLQAHQVSAPTLKELSGILVERLRGRPMDGGLSSVEEAAVPVTAEESARHRVLTSFSFPEALRQKLRRSLDAPVEELVEQKVILSGEMLARVIPQLTAQVKASGVSEPALRRLYSAIYVAFRRRRSLLLLNFESQVKLEDLPWLRAIEAEQTAGVGEREAARVTLEQLMLLYFGAFPQVIVPNKLLQEVRALAKAADLNIPIVDELAADIFMGDFTEKFLHAAKLAARLLKGTLYERYYGIDFSVVERISDPPVKKGARISAAFGELCFARAEERRTTGWTWRSVANNGKVIEQAQILTTQNLAVLFDVLSLRRSLDRRLAEVAQACFKWIFWRLQLKITKKKAQLQRLKNCAYAWRQMVFYLSLQPESQQLSFLRWATQELEKQPPAFASRFKAALDRLHDPARGSIFLGWTTSPHWLMSQ